jgi:hypothetical protein
MRYDAMRQRGDSSVLPPCWHSTVHCVRPNENAHQLRAIVPARTQTNASLAALTAPERRPAPDRPVGCMRGLDGTPPRNLGKPKLDCVFPDPVVCAPPNGWITPLGKAIRRKRPVVRWYVLLEEGRMRTRF